MVKARLRNNVIGLILKVIEAPRLGKLLIVVLNYLIKDRNKNSIKWNEI